MIAILTDRPNVGKEIARIVGAHRFEKGYMTGNGYAVTWTFGNMLSLAMPKDYGNAKLERKDFPLVPGDFRLMVKHVRTDEGWIPDISAVMQLKTVEKVLAECDTIIAATEASREGEMTFRYLYRYLGCRQPVQRLWLSSLTDEAVRKGMTNLLPVRMFDRMFLASDSRNKADWLLGMNASYALCKIRDAIHAPNTLHKLQTGLEVGRIYHPEFLLLLWELGYRHKKTEDWQKDNSLTNTTKMRLYCLDKLFDNTLNIDLKEILTSSSIIQAVCLIEDIRNNRITFTNHPNWKSRINSIRSASNHPLNNYWGYIDMALDNFHTKKGQSMRTYLCQKEPGIKLDNKEETIVKETNLYKALTILYPDIYN